MRPGCSHGRVLLSGEPDREKRLAATAMMIGGVAIARALDDTETKDELLAACRKFVPELLEISDGTVAREV